MITCLIVLKHVSRGLKTQIRKTSSISAFANARKKILWTRFRARFASGPQHDANLLKCTGNTLERASRRKAVQIRKTSSNPPCANTRKKCLDPLLRGVCASCPQHDDNAFNHASRGPKPRILKTNSIPPYANTRETCFGFRLLRT
jgi:hypothetical protein